MFSTKIRNVAVSLITASSLAVAIVPAASAAPNIPGRFQKSSEGLKTVTVSCYGDKDRYNQLVNASEEFLQESKSTGDAKFEGARAAGEAATHVREAAKAGGCSWAQ
jgi:hypothetical protein